MRAGLLVLLVGCGRLGFTPPADDVAPTADSAIAALDAPADSAPTLLEMMTVPSNGDAPTSATVLDEGVRYILVASGTFTAVPPAVDPMADAEYYDLTDPGKGPIDVDASNQIDFGLAIDTPSVGTVKTPAHWGAYRDDHTYTVDFIGKGAPIQAKIFDCCYSDNTGTLALAIYAP